MAASVESLGPALPDITHPTAGASSGDEELEWVLPSDIDCFGRDAPRLPFAVRLRRHLSPRALLTLADSIRVWVL